MHSRLWQTNHEQGVSVWYSPKMIANSFNRQFTTSKLDKHFSLRTRQVSKDVKRMSLEEAESFTSAIKTCRSSRAYGHDCLSILHLKNLGPLATEHLTSLYNDSLKYCRLPSIWKTTFIIPIPKPGKDSSQGTSYGPISLLCPTAKDLEALILPSINEFLSPAKDQHGFRSRHSTISALLQFITDIETCFNQRKPPSLYNVWPVDLTAAFDTVSHDILISKIAGSSLPTNPPPLLDGCHGTLDRLIHEEEKMADSINGSNYGILNWDSPTRVPPNAEPSFARCLISISISHHLMLVADTQRLAQTIYQSSLDYR